MNSPALLKPTLYSKNTDDAFDPPFLLGRACSCGHVFFPPQDFGCEKCGNTGMAIKPLRLEGTGHLLSWATVHMHARDYPKAPFVVGKVALDGGPVIRALLRVGSEAGLRAQTRVNAVLVPVGDEQGHLDLWFAPSGIEEI